MLTIRFLVAIAIYLLTTGVHGVQAGVIDIGSQRELFVDRYLIDRLEGATLKLHSPQLTPLAPGSFRGAYSTVIKDGDLYRRYYRAVVEGYQGEGYDGHPGEYTAYAESPDGIHWTRPNLGLFEINGSRDNNAILANASPFSHNFSPFLDTRPAVAPEQRYKALAGVHKGGGLAAFVSEDGIRWKKLHEKLVLTSEEFAFDSQNVSFWSEAEQLYVCYYRAWKTPHGRLRSINRTTSTDYLNWTDPVAMEPNASGEHLYTSQTHPYFRAPHIYVALPTRFHPDRGSSTDILFMAMRAGQPRYARLFLEAFIRPGLNPKNWGNRSNYAALNVVPTGPAEMSIYVRDRRFVLRTDGFVSVHASHQAGQLLTVPLTFDGGELEINYSTSAAGSVQIEIQDPEGLPLQGFSLGDCDRIVGDEVSRIVTWEGSAAVGDLADNPVRLRFVLTESDLFSFRFVGE